MIRKIEKIENSHVLVFDDALLKLTQLKEGDQVNVEVESCGTIKIFPIKSEPTEGEIQAAIEDMMEDYAPTLRKLSE